ncbi:similar to Saccharomyces cerevisiae YMR283C RIT1 2'-O-ribosyl phosphate transferase, modifies the initiator methionine tRNA at position 64 to distinguish it from elongator methionine tRNA [Maudiozyma barnettii]|uniref:Similar to Saccharomyces cerevisiae YMR283C RIT1 2'-O-ribosyl phosphate transferase, modifies the initiator methionine tRNA at position 64 to distinguish it from elongator methionine tRNA n=1 Tax=Maudiozyma barnettii TaxID=61262 RepID=A0A8H2VCA2_9SACH|nr:similar to Saccharomyces cerevisiae YMR283C RIT1 2'-O-ribosyl phosphate transferase, modifies the initiator methionine tRNA at position 64 to distinguish it from elongator methionine tRNA [Kazachstania barnettii]CAB4252621.1 similar to Saccharomyces cerevisiae YMR283C RIT1 2'-O-ribosyl phosphate transferase, modifies the initiator methionine tRNA at position 64 to distinguish it from elongator methionine tRNA [Kazachstania barnettii]CAD1780081.1 similar to Saccharomyces cerevisiae YMR283C RIT1
MENSNWNETLSQLNKDIRKENKSLRNRLLSISYDHQFLESQVREQFKDYALIPNERCGIWYCDPKTYGQTSYFKSTDGHTSQWDFSTRRLNFHLFPTLQEKGGIIIVDSTRRGKKIPDSLSKTIPIWCAVVNFIMLESAGIEFETEDILFVPPVTVSANEYHSISLKLPALVEKMKTLGALDGKKLYNSLNGRILRPIWVYPGSSILQNSVDPFTGESINSEWKVPENEKIIPLILCTVSYQAQDGMDKRNGFTYVQGAADDHELWSEGLTPQMFWEHYAYLTNPKHGIDELENYIKELVLTKAMAQTSLKETIDDIIKPIEHITERLSLGRIMENSTINKGVYQELSNEYKVLIILSDNVKVETDPNNPNTLIKIYNLQSGSKKSSKDLRIKLPEIYDTIHCTISESSNVLVCCNTGADISIGVLLSVLCKDYTQDWKFEPKGEPLITKTVIRKHFSQLITHLNGRNINVSRATLNSVNSFLM